MSNELHSMSLKVFYFVTWITYISDGGAENIFETIEMILLED